jgi:ATP-dependent DNA ligase
MRLLGRYGSVAAVAGVSALLAVGAARLAMPCPKPQGTDLHALLHSEMKLSAAQERKIDALEASFSRDRKVLDDKLRNANAAIAAAYLSEHGYGPKVSEAIDRSHIAMGELQKLTLRHVFAMRAELTAEQALVFDREVEKALTRSPDH